VSDALVACERALALGAGDEVAQLRDVLEGVAPRTLQSAADAAGAAA